MRVNVDIGEMEKANKNLTMLQIKEKWSTLSLLLTSAAILPG